MTTIHIVWNVAINPLNAELNPICHLLTLLGGATIVVISRLRVNISFQMISRHILCYGWNFREKVIDFVASFKFIFSESWPETYRN